MEFYKGLLRYGSKMQTWDTALGAYSQATIAGAINPYYPSSFIVVMMPD
ncbi:hypothetical protein [Legionella bononiensis]|nr:hypothetical protein [Legionella bononiensis]